MKPVMMFVLGAILASGTVMLLMKPSNPPAPAPVVSVPAVTPEPAKEPDPVLEEPKAEVIPPPPPVRSSRPSPVSTRSESRRSSSSHVITSSSKPATPPPAPVAPPKEAQPAPTPVAESRPAEPVNTARNNAPEPVQQPNIPPGAVIDVPPPPIERKPNVVTIPAGTLLAVRLNEQLNTEKNTSGDAFRASLDQPLVVDGFVLAERGAKVTGRISELDRGGRVSGLAKMTLELTQIATSDGQRIQVHTDSFSREAESNRKRDAAKVGAAAGIGAAIGAIAGGGKGAAIGAAIGGASGAGGVMATRGKAAEIPVETKLSFRLSQAVTVTEKIH